MARKALAVAVGTLVAAAPLSAAGPGHDHGPGAPLAGAEARYCMKVEAVTGTRIETVKCWTRQEWAEQGVDLDKEWPREGVRVVGA